MKSLSCKISMMIKRKKTIVILLSASVLAITSCAGDKASKKTQEPVSSSSGGSSSSSEAKESREDSASSSLSGERRLLTNSLSNNGLTSKAIDKTKAADFASQQGGGKSKDMNTLVAALAANRLSGRPVNDAMMDAKAIADIEMSKNVDRDLPELAQLELGLTGVQTGRLAFAEFWLDKLLESKNPNIKASAINAKGVMAIKMERIPEAMFLFKKALAANSEYKPALLNIGFLALQGGDAATAKKALSGMQEDWYVESGMVSILRLEGEVDRADGVCEKVLSKYPRHKPTLINCGINSWQGKKDYKKARSYLNRALAVAGGAAVWDEKTGKLLGSIDADESREAQLKSLKEAEERKAKTEAEKPKTEAQDPKAGGAPAGSGAKP